MTSEKYTWTKRDKWLYLLSMLPFIIVFLGTIFLLSTFNLVLVIILISLFLVTNLFQAGCCVGCPYQGEYCPALCGVYLGNLLSGFLYKNRKFNQEFFNRNAKGGEFMLLITILFPVYWIYKTSWLLIPVYFLLLFTHFLLFMPTQCEKCSYNTTCPGGKAWLVCRKRLNEIGNKR